MILYNHKVCRVRNSPQRYKKNWYFGQKNRLSYDFEFSDY